MPTASSDRTQTLKVKVSGERPACHSVQRHAESQGGRGEKSEINGELTSGSVLESVHQASGIRGMEQLREDVTCSICLDVLSDPVSIECGHSFGRGCLSTHWSQISAQGHCCPECWAPCSGDRMIPNKRVKNLVEKITKPLQEETESQGPGAQPEPGRPVQLVHLDEEENLILDEEALSRCLEQGGVGDAPVCLVSIIGEQRRGKSFLLNYLLRRLRSPQDARDGSWMGREDEPLEGFEWRADEERVTKGVWAWSQSFWVPAKAGKVAVLLVDTEGSMDIESNKETSIKLSAFSMLLSSYQILNTGCRVKDPDLEYLEMFVQVAEVVGEAYGLEPIQHLDLLVRDWSSSRVLGAQGGEQHLRHVRQKLEAKSPCKHPKALEALKGNRSRCYLMPFPGERITMGSEGTLRDMGENFRESLRDYVTTLVSSASQHVQTDRHGEMLTGTQLAAKIKNLSDVMKKHHFGFSSPCQMAITFHNQRVVDSARTDHAVFLREKDGLSQRMVDCLKVDPSAMAEQFKEQRRSLLERCREEMREPEKETLLTALEAELAREANSFLETYRRCYQSHAINQRVMDRARTDHADFLREKDGLSQRMVDCLKVDPSAMAEQLVEQRRSLLEQCQKEMKESEETLMTALKAELTREAETFLGTYRRRFQSHNINKRVMDRARQDHADFLREKHGLSQRMVDCLKVDPSAMAEQFVQHCRSLLEQCWKEMEEPEETLLTALEVELTQEADTFLETYGGRYQCHANNQRAMDSARRDHADFLREKHGLSQRMVDCLKVDPSAMAEQLVEQRRSLLERCREEMEEPEETLLMALKAELTKEAQTFLEKYRRCYERHAFNQRTMDSARQDHADFLKEKDDLSQHMFNCLMVTPSAMEKQFVEKCRSLLERCQKEMQEPKEALLTALEKELTREANGFLETYRKRFQCHLTILGQRLGQGLILLFAAKSSFSH
ncbi:RING finger protein 112-like isoform X3 [Dermochelys coriacea]|uniref:RING finger protein 112-like isoform X3 n=1 Tax=Dermochelys coriacea TaxID=27794 RepID=UPI001CA92390|nr:RING finger protein 112-like isoform X3 [Dermochelys coriacea]